MGKDPATLFYWNDWHGGTITLSRHLKGCYMDLLYAQFNNGHLALEEIRIVLAEDFNTSWTTLKKKFKVDENGLYYNERLVSEAVKRRAFSTNQSDKANRRWQSPGNAAIEDENEIESIIGYLNEKANLNFKKDGAKNVSCVRARLKEGYTLKDFQDVIDFKNHVWGSDTKMREFLRPETLFSTKFEGYLNAARSRPLNSIERKIDANQKVKDRYPDEPTDQT